MIAMLLIVIFEMNNRGNFEKQCKEYFGDNNTLVSCDEFHCECYPVRCDVPMSVGYEQCIRALNKDLEITARKPRLLWE